LLTPAVPAYQGPLDTTDARAVTELGRTLIAHGFAGEAVLRAMGQPPGGAKAHIRDDLPLYLRRLRDVTPLNTLIRLFVLMTPVDEHAAREAFAPSTLDQVERMGLLRRTEDGVVARVRLSGCLGLILAHDSYDARSTLPADHVLDVNPTTNTLAALTVRHRVRTALDLGTGCGVLALLAARHADHVIGTDTNQRALNFASFNAALNGSANVEFRLGSLFEPVAGERFGLIACNPPYVISPDSRYIFRDGNRRGHGLCEEVVRRAPDHLEAGGFATVLCNWGIASGEHWSAPLRQWVARSGCDTWMLCSGSQDPLTYAATWNRGPDKAGYEEALERWPAYYRELGFDDIGMGAVIMRRGAAGDGWIRADMLPESPLQPDESLIARIFDSQDVLARLESDTALLDVPFRTVAAHRLEQMLHLQNGGYVAGSAAIQLEAGLKFRGDVDDFTIRVLMACNGARTLGEIALDLAARSGRDSTEMRRATAVIARRLVSLGFLTVSHHTEDAHEG